MIYIYVNINMHALALTHVTTIGVQNSVAETRATNIIRIWDAGRCQNNRVAFAARSAIGRVDKTVEWRKVSYKMGIAGSVCRSCFKSTCSRQEHQYE